MEGTESIQDVAEILAEPDILSTLSPEEAEVGAKLLPVLTARISKETIAKYGAEYRDRMEKMEEATKEALTKAIEDLRESVKPLSPEEIGKLLSQEYGTFEITLGGGKEGPLTFTICELPARAEKRLAKAIKETVAPIMRLISADEWVSLAGASQLERVDKIIDLVPGALDVLGECVAVCLDPMHEKDFITGEWVLNHIGMNKIVVILTAQIEACRYRDFFSLVSRLYQQNRMTTA